MKRINLYKLLTIIKISIFSIIFITNIAVYSSDDSVNDDKKVEEKVDEITESEIKEIDDSIKTFEDIVEKFQNKIPVNNQSKPWRSERRLFINTRGSIITLIITDKNNKQYRYILPIGSKKYIESTPSQIKRVVCRDKCQEKDIIVPQAALNLYSVFIFNFDPKPEQIHFIDAKQKFEILNKTKNTLRNAQLFAYHDKKLIERLTKKVNELQDRTIYLQ